MVTSLANAAGAGSTAAMKPAIYGEKPKDGLTDALLADADRETRELLGVAGYM